MKYIEQHIAQVEVIFEQYKGQEPLHLFLKKYFKKYKKFGSKDRRNITEYLYGVFRMGRENRHLSIRERVYFFLFLKGDLPSSFFELNFKELVPLYGATFCEKLDWLKEQYELRHTFRTQEYISDRIDNTAYRNSFYQEPDVFIRLRKDSHKKYEPVILENQGHFITNEIISFPSKVKLETILKAEDYVVQDWNSQRTADFYPALRPEDQVWDCCAGSGGKSILLLDRYPNIQLTVTDIRASILRSLIERFSLYGLEAETIAEANVNKEKDLEILAGQGFDFILCDVPCSGSGTWSRTPEQFYYFEKKEVAKFQKRQLSILENTARFLKKGGTLLYITCSVFAEENEAVIASFLKENSFFEKKESAYLDGTAAKADTLYVCSLQKL